MARRKQRESTLDCYDAWLQTERHPFDHAESGMDEMDFEPVFDPYLEGTDEDWEQIKRDRQSALRESLAEEIKSRQVAAKIRGQS
jgi:hypothetical protein